MNMVKLFTERLIIDDFKKNDISREYLSWLLNPEVVRYSNQRFKLHSEESCLEYFEGFKGSSNLFLAIREKSKNKMIGTMTVYCSKEHNTADIGIMLGDLSSWGKGYGQESWNTVSSWLLEVQVTRKITAGTLSCNKGMLRIMQNSGMFPDGIRKEQEIVDGLARDVLFYAKFRND